MPVSVDSSYSSHDHLGIATSPLQTPPSYHPDRPGRGLAIGLINNMPEAAFKATERQFISLLDLASGDIPIRALLYEMPDIRRPESSGPHIGSMYSSVEMLWDTHLDGLIVTGTEPMKSDLRDERYWDSFTRVVEWARNNTYSTVWSCLAAHGAVLHLDNIGRRRSLDKHFGVFECLRACAHSLTEGVPPSFQVPHSRWNGIAEQDLAARGYLVLARTAHAEVDLFVKEENSLFVFFQGHPEYQSDTLLREYRRDVGRYIRHEADSYPAMPRGYFDHDTESALFALREKAKTLRSKELLAGLAVALEKKHIENTWHSTATRIYRNWLEYICARQNESLGAGQLNSTCAVPR